MPKKTDLIIVDTNLWLSFLIKKNYSKLDRLLVSGQVKLCFSEELLSEFMEVAKRPKFKKYFKKEDLDDILNSINSFAQFYEVTTVEKVCRDPKDDFLIALANISKADYLITGDDDLLTLKKVGKTRIITISEYLKTK